MYISAQTIIQITNKDKKKEQKDVRKEEIKKFRKRKIEEIEQDEEVICIISKYSNIRNQYFTAQSERIKKCYSQMINMASDSSQKKN